MTGIAGLPSGPNKWWQVPGAAVRMIALFAWGLASMAWDAVFGKRSGT